MVGVLGEKKKARIAWRGMLLDLTGRLVAWCFGLYSCTYIHFLICDHFVERDPAAALQIDLRVSLCCDIFVHTYLIVTKTLI